MVQQKECKQKQTLLEGYSRGGRSVRSSKSIFANQSINFGLSHGRNYTSSLITRHIHVHVELLNQCNKSVTKFCLKFYIQEQYPDVASIFSIPTVSAKDTYNNARI